MTIKDRKANEYLAELYDSAIGHKPLPAALTDLNDQQWEAVADLVSEILEKEEAAYTKLFESLAMMMKYVPNFILHQIIPRYVEPAIAAKITHHLSSKQIIGVASGLDVEYISEASTHMNEQTAAKVLEGLKSKLASQVIEHAVLNYPLSVLDILPHTSPRFRKEATQHYQRIEIDHGQLCSRRMEIYQSLSITS